MLYQAISCYVVFDFDRHNTDPDRIKESKDLLKLIGAADADNPPTATVEADYSFFASKEGSGLSQ
jgi:hypothetical protein